MSKLLETFQELNLSNYGPDDVDQLNAWAIDAYAELSAIKAPEPVAEFFALDDGIGTIMAAWADGFEPVVGQMLYAAPVISAEQQVALPEWAPCNPGCDPEFNGQRSAGCARYCENARAAMLVAAPAPAPVSEAEAQVYEPLVCDYCNAETQDPWHGSGMLNGVESRHIHACNQCRNLLPTAKAQGVVMPEREVITNTIGFEFLPGELQTVNSDDLVALVRAARLTAAPVQQVSVPDGSAKMQWPEIVALVNEVLGCEAHKYPCERGSIGHEMTGINFNSLARIIDRVRYAAPAAPAADAWIPVSERLPEVESRLDQECRVGTLSIAPLNVSAAVLVFDGEKVRSTRLEWFDCCLPLPYCITHWMPLPAAPADHSSKGVV